MADNIQALVVPAALGRIEAYVASAIAALSAREVLVMALDASRPLAHPFSERDALAPSSKAGLTPLAAADAPAGSMRFHILEQGGPTLSNNRWSLGPASTLGMRVAFTPAGERARVRTCSASEAQKLAERHQLWWWRWGRELGLVKGPFALPIAPWDLREPLSELRVGDSLTSHHTATLELLPGALLGQAAGLSLAALLHLGVGGAVLLGTLAGISRLGIGLHVTRPSWLSRPPLGISIVRLGPNATDDAHLAAPALPQGDTGDVFWSLERRLFIEQTDATLTQSLPGESEPSAASVARARARATLLEVALIADDGAPWIAPSIDIPLLVSGHVGLGWRQGERHTYLLDAARASGRLVLALLRDAQARSELRHHTRLLPQAQWEAQLFCTSRSASREALMPNVSLWGMRLGGGRFAELETLSIKLRENGVDRHVLGVAQTEQVVHWGYGRRTTTLTSWGNNVAHNDAAQLAREEILRKPQDAAELFAEYASISPKAACAIAQALDAKGQRSPRLPVWSKARTGLRLHVHWHGSESADEAQKETHAAFVARHTPFSLRQVARDLRTAKGSAKMDVRWQQTEELFELVRWFLAALGAKGLSEGARQQAQSLCARLEAEEFELQQDPISALSPARLAGQLMESQRLRAALMPMQSRRQSGDSLRLVPTAMEVACEQARVLVLACKTKPATTDQKQQARALVAQLRREEDGLHGDSSLVHMAPMTLSHQLAMSKAQRHELHRLYCTRCP